MDGISLGTKQGMKNTKTKSHGFSANVYIGLNCNENPLTIRQLVG